MAKIDYNQYTEGALRRKPVAEMNEFEKEYYDSVADQEASKILGKLYNNNGAQFSRSVAMALAAQVLKDKRFAVKEEEEKSDDLLN